MQKIARAFNFPETTFITGGSYREGYDVRIFTPVLRCRLPAIPHSVSYLLRHVINRQPASTITLTWVLAL